MVLNCHSPVTTMWYMTSMMQSCDASIAVGWILCSGLAWERRSWHKRIYQILQTTPCQRSCNTPFKSEMWKLHFLCGSGFSQHNKYRFTQWWVACVLYTYCIGHCQCTCVQAFVCIALHKEYISRDYRFDQLLLIMKVLHCPWLPWMLLCFGMQRNGIAAYSIILCVTGSLSTAYSTTTL